MALKIKSTEIQIEQRKRTLIPASVSGEYRRKTSSDLVFLSKRQEKGCGARRTECSLGDFELNRIRALHIPEALLS